jgi:hypothetical protein
MLFFLYFREVAIVFLVNIHSDKDCWNNDNNTISRKYAVLVNFSPKINYEKENCSVHIVNPWSSDIQNGFGVFLPHSMDCSSTVTIECLQGNNLSKQVFCHKRLVFLHKKYLFCIATSGIYMLYKFPCNRNGM